MQTSWLQNISCSTANYMMLWGETCGQNQYHWGSSFMATWRSWGGQPLSWGRQASPYEEEEEPSCWPSFKGIQGSKFPPVRLPGTSIFSVWQPKTLSPLALWASRFWVQLLVKRCQPKAMISFSSTVGLVSFFFVNRHHFNPSFLTFILLHPPQLCSLTEKAKLSCWGAWRPRAHSMVSLVIIDLDRKYFVT